MKAGYLNLWYNLPNQNVNILYHLYSEEHGEHSNQGDIFCGIYRCYERKLHNLLFL